MFWDKWKTGGLIRNPASSQGLNEDAGMPMRILMKRPITKTETLFLVVTGGKDGGGNNPPEKDFNNTKHSEEDVQQNIFWPFIPNQPPAE